HDLALARCRLVSLPIREAILAQELFQLLIQLCLARRPFCRINFPRASVTVEKICFLVELPHVLVQKKVQEPPGLVVAEVAVLNEVPVDLLEGGALLAAPGFFSSWIVESLRGEFDLALVRRGKRRVRGRGFLP